MAHLTAAARALAAISGRARLLGAITTGVAGLRRGALATLRLADGGALRLAACAGPAQAPAHAGSLDDDLAREVLARGRPLFVSDGRGDPRVRRPAVWREWGYAAYYGVPLPGPEGGVGVLGLVLPAGLKAPGPEERRMLEMYAAHAALALRHEAAAATVERQRRALEVARDELFEAAKLVALGHLVSDVVHQISNLLGSATLRMEALRDAPHDDDTAAQLHVLDAHCRDIAALLGQLRRFSRPGDSPELGLDVEALVDHLIELRRVRLRSRGIEVERVRQDGVIPIRADRVALERALLALLLEAEEALGAGGTIAVTTGPGPDGTAPSVRVTVEDDGPAIPPSRLALVFDPFAPRAEGRGPSITLAAAHAAVTAQGGRLEVANRAGGGVVFRLDLPAGRAP